MMLTREKFAHLQEVTKKVLIVGDGVISVYVESKVKGELQQQVVMGNNEILLDVGNGGKQLSTTCSYRLLAS